ncbi:hypothetical protein EV182_000199 [Spiromyces aspiralis]|uniref:Uncharacterized protein n=1 Tax=Spiromyces aspiralis TaxID=68401 RepID=A0ACC1HKV1_9FUNG|nr:hypothetical protein EV182_000199 [Spiromyces aspiralis]
MDATLPKLVQRKPHSDSAKQHLQDEAETVVADTGSRGPEPTKEIQGGRRASHYKPKSQTYQWFKSIVGAATSIIVLNLCLSYLFTESFTWGVQNKWTNWRNYIPRKEVVLTLDELRKYDGTDPNLPIYLAIK